MTPLDFLWLDAERKFTQVDSSESGAPCYFLLGELDMGLVSSIVFQPSNKGLHVCINVSTFKM